MSVSEQVEFADPDEVGMSADRLTRAGSLIDDQVDSGRAVGAQLLVARNGQPVYTRSAGDARPGGPPLDLSHIFPIASQGKPMTAAVVLALAERGLVGINEPAAKHLPELAADHGGVLVAHLLTHTSGWSGEDHDAARDAKLGEAIASIPTGADPLSHILIWPGWDVARRFEPGERMQYAGWNYDLLSEIIRRVTGDTLDAAMRRYLFGPAGMTSSALIVGDGLIDRLVERPPGIPFGPDHPASPISFSDPVWRASDSGASGIHCSAVDLVRFGQLFLDRGIVDGVRVLSDAAVEVMTTNRVPGIPAVVLGHELAEASWGYGFSVMGHNVLPKFGAGIADPATLRHGGAAGTSLWFDPTTGVSAAYLELVTEVDETGVAPASWIGHRIEAMVTAAVVE